MLQLAGVRPIEFHLDLGTGTGSVLRSFAKLARQSVGIDQSREMLAIARSNLADDRSMQVRQGDIYALPFADSSSDFITIHQVLHYLDDPQRALQEATRVLQPGGRLLIAEFAPHELEQLREEHAHRRLGIADDQMQAWLARAGATLKRHDVLPPPWIKGGEGLTVSLWLAEKPGATVSAKPLAGLEVSR
jgi:ubiquinone/menaquinone biosynthesis C-methylase UbiE